MDKHRLCGAGLCLPAAAGGTSCPGTPGTLGTLTVRAKLSFAAGFNSSGGNRSLFLRGFSMDFVFKITTEKGGKSNTRNSSVEETQDCRNYFMDTAEPSSFTVPIPNLAWNSLPFESWIRNVFVTGFTAHFHSLGFGNRSTNCLWIILCRRGMRESLIPMTCTLNLLFLKSNPE